MVNLVLRRLGDRHIKLVFAGECFETSKARLKVD
jgi:hypothetical protein